MTMLSNHKKINSRECDNTVQRDRYTKPSFRGLENSFYETLYSLMRSSKLEGKFFWYMNFILFITEFPKPGKGAWHTTGTKKKFNSHVIEWMNDYRKLRYCLLPIRVQIHSISSISIMYWACIEMMRMVSFQTLIHLGKQIIRRLWWKYTPLPPV